MQIKNSPTQPAQTERFKIQLVTLRAKVIECDEAALGKNLAELLLAREVKTLLTADPSAQPRIATLTREAETLYQQAGRGVLTILPFTEQIEAFKERLFSAEASFEHIPYGLAETGSLVVTADSTSPRTLSLVPALHIAWIRRQNVLSNFSELLAQFKHKRMPSNLILISGPSKTADIEMTLVHGIHGPRELIVLLTD